LVTWWRIVGKLRAGEELFEKPGGVGAATVADEMGRRAGGDHATASVASFRSEIDYIVGFGNDIEIMFDDYECSTTMTELPESTILWSTASRLTISAVWSPVVGSSRK